MPWPGRDPRTGLSPSEQRIINTLREKPAGWERKSIVAELSKGRKVPLTEASFKTHVAHLREMGFKIECRKVYAFTGMAEE